MELFFPSSGVCGPANTAKFTNCTTCCIVKPHAVSEGKYCVKYNIANTAKSLQSCPTLCDPIDGSPPGSAVSGILQARTLLIAEFVNICFLDIGYVLKLKYSFNISIHFFEGT